VRETEAVGEHAGVGATEGVMVVADSQSKCRSIIGHGVKRKRVVSVGNVEFPEVNINDKSPG
jgi:hypothetical protein